MPSQGTEKLGHQTEARRAVLWSGLAMLQKPHRRWLTLGVSRSRPHAPRAHP